MDLFTAIEKRHSYRGPFRDSRIPREDLRRIVQAGIQAPSGCNAQSTTFVIVDDPDLLASVFALFPGKQVPPALIVCVANPVPVFNDMSFDREDCAAAVENMLLAITALGYATVWLDGMLRTEDRAEKIGRMLGIPEALRVQIILPLGVPAEQWEQKEKLPFERRAWFSRYEGK